VSGKYDRRGIFLVHPLGTGSGLVSLTLACVLSSQRMDDSLEKAPGPSILATDLPSAVELIEQNLDANQRIWEGVDAKAGVLDWDDQNLPTEVIDAPPDVLVYVSTITFDLNSDFYTVVWQMLPIIHLPSHHSFGQLTRFYDWHRAARLC